MNLPKVRFKEFSGDWKCKTLGEICTFSQGIQVPLKEQGSNYYEGSVPFIRIGNVTMKNEQFRYIDKPLDQYLVSREDIFMVRYGAVGVVGRGLSGALANNLFKINLTEKKLIDDSFLYYYLQVNKVNARILSLVSSTAIPALSFKYLKSLVVHYPESFLEQSKIVSFCMLLNKKMELQQEKIRKLKLLKKGLIQKILSQEIQFRGRNSNGFSATWEEKKLCDISVPIKRKQKEINYNLPVLTISATKGFLKQTDRFSQVIAGESLCNYTLLRKGELSYNRGVSKNFPYGCIYSLKSFEEALVPGIYRSFQLKEGYLPAFYEQLFAAGYLNQQLRQFVSSSTRLNGLLNISPRDFFSIKVPAPSIKEQKEIANLLARIDLKINKEKERMVLLEEEKKGYMQGVFI